MFEYLTDLISFVEFSTSESDVAEDSKLNDLCHIFSFRSNTRDVLLLSYIRSFRNFYLALSIFLMNTLTFSDVGKIIYLFDLKYDTLGHVQLNRK